MVGSHFVFYHLYSEYQNPNYMVFKSFWNLNVQYSIPHRTLDLCNCLVLNITRQVYKLFKDQWNESLGFFQKVLKRDHSQRV